MTTFSANDVNVAVALASGTLTIVDCFNDRLQEPYTAISDEHGLITVCMTNQEAQDYVRKIADTIQRNR